MSAYKTPEIFTYKAGGVVSQYQIVKHGAKDEEVLACGADEQGIGSCLTAPIGQVGEELEIAGSNGGGLVRVAGALSRGTLFKSDANGKAVAALDRSEALGMIDESADAADQVVACVWF